MAANKKYLVWVFIAFLVTVPVAFFFYHFGHNDAQALADFSNAYAQYDQAVSSLAQSVLASNPQGGPVSNDPELKVDGALAELNRKASTRISSLTRNDADLMQAMLEVADLSAKELVALKEYKTAVADGSADMNKVANVYHDLSQKRQSAYARFQELAGMK